MTKKKRINTFDQKRKKRENGHPSHTWLTIKHGRELVNILSKLIIYPTLKFFGA